MPGLNMLTADRSLEAFKQFDIDHQKTWTTVCSKRCICISILIFLLLVALVLIMVTSQGPTQPTNQETKGQSKEPTKQTYENTKAQTKDPTKPTKPTLNSAQTNQQNSATTDYLRHFVDQTGENDPCVDFATLTCPYYRKDIPEYDRRKREVVYRTGSYQDKQTSTKNVFESFVEVGSNAQLKKHIPEYSWVSDIYKFYQSCVDVTNTEDWEQLKHTVQNSIKLTIKSVLSGTVNETTFVDLYLLSGVQFPFKTTLDKWATVTVTEHLRSLNGFERLWNLGLISLEGDIHASRDYTPEEFQTAHNVPGFWDWGVYFRALRLSNVKKVRAPKRTRWILEHLLRNVTQTRLVQYFEENSWIDQFTFNDDENCKTFVEKEFPEALAASYQIKHRATVERNAAFFGQIVNLFKLQILNTISSLVEKKHAHEFRQYLNKLVMRFGLLYDATEVWSKHFSNQTFNASFYVDFPLTLRSFANATAYASLRENYFDNKMNGKYLLYGSPFILFTEPPIINIPIKFMTAPTYNPALSYAAQFGMFHFVFGHELSHAFFNTTAWSTSASNLVDVFGQKYMRFEQCVKKSYGRHTITKAFSDKVPVEKTYSETFADIFGLHLAWKVYQNNFKNLEKTNIDYLGYSHDEVFFLFLGMNSISCEDFASEYALWALQEQDPHVIGANRVNALLKETPEFANTFRCLAGQSMNPAPHNRCLTILGL